jgi:uncharacterized protein (TIGR03067 family)
MRPAALFLAACLLTSATAAQDAKAPGPFQGTWDVTKLEQTGDDLTDTFKGETATMAFDGNRYTFTLGEEVEKGTFKLDEKAKTLDLVIVEGTNKGKKQLGIYKLDGNKLTLCLAEEGAKVRPTKFGTTEDGPEFVMFTLKRRAK